MSWWTKKGRRIATAAGLVAGTALTGGALGAGAAGIFGLSGAATGALAGGTLGAGLAAQNDASEVANRNMLREQEKANNEAISNAQVQAGKVQQNVEAGTQEALRRALMKRGAGFQRTVRTAGQFSEGRQTLG